MTSNEPYWKIPTSCTSIYAYFTICERSTVSRTATSTTSTRQALWCGWFIAIWLKHVPIDVETASLIGLGIENERSRLHTSVVMGLTCQHFWLSRANTSLQAAYTKVVSDTTSPLWQVPKDGSITREAWNGFEILTSIQKGGGKVDIRCWC